MVKIVRKKLGSGGIRRAAYQQQRLSIALCNGSARFHSLLHRHVQHWKIQLVRDCLVKLCARLGFVSQGRRIKRGNVGRLSAFRIEDGLVCQPVRDAYAEVASLIDGHLGDRTIFERITRQEELRPRHIRLAIDRHHRIVLVPDHGDSFIEHIEILYARKPIPTVAGTAPPHEHAAELVAIGIARISASYHSMSTRSPLNSEHHRRAAPHLCVEGLEELFAVAIGGSGIFHIARRLEPSRFQRLRQERNICTRIRTRTLARPHHSDKHSHVVGRAAKHLAVLLGQARAPAHKIPAVFRNR